MSPALKADRPPALPVLLPALRSQPAGSCLKTDPWEPCGCGEPQMRSPSSWKKGAGGPGVTPWELPCLGSPSWGEGLLPQLALCHPCQRQLRCTEAFVWCKPHTDSRQICLFPEPAMPGQAEPHWKLAPGDTPGRDTGFCLLLPLPIPPTTPSANCWPICNKDNSLDTASSALSAIGAMV